MKKIYYLSVLPAFILLLADCKKETKTNTTTTSKYATGYDVTRERQDTIPKAINTRGFAGASAAPLPASYDIIKYLPPVGDQGQYGTCIGWSSGYYNKSALEAVANNYSASQLASTSHQMSAVDLFTAIADGDKGANCDGTSYGAALTVMQNRGVATLAAAPYVNLNTCSQSTLTSAGTADAPNHTVKNFRALSDASIADYIADIKQNLVTNTPVMIPIGVGAGFQNWTGSGVMNTGFDPCGGGGTCGGHAQTIVGYDDSKNAFRIVNSWNTTWGDGGFYWCDYNFLFNTLAEKDQNGAYGVYVATNGASNGTDTVAPVNPTSGVDLAAWVQEDDNEGTSQDPTQRKAIYNIYNIGTGDAQPQPDPGWGLYYVYYNAFDATDYGVIFYDQFSTSIATNTDTCSPSGNNCIINVTIPAGNDLANYAFGTSTLYQYYDMPNITGDYYLILVADAGQTLNDADYSNNIFYTSEYYAPFVNGVFKRATQTNLWPTFNNPIKPTPQLLRHSSFNSAVTKSHPNAYTPKEIMGFIKQKKATGELDAKARAAGATTIGSHGGLPHVTK